MYSWALFPLFTALAQAQTLIESSSFGHKGRISENGYEVPGWHVSGEGQVPELLSDKVILTPPYPGNMRGAIWSNSKVTENDWAAELDFRASGPDRGSGNLQIWYARDGRTTVGTSSLYTVGKFDGIVLVVDQYGGKGGSIRGFLDDGNTDFRQHSAIDTLAFGHCNYSFRNLGRPVKLRLRQEPENFSVIIDGKLCFSSDNIRMPTDYTFGLTAASAETPDSFEAYKFQLSSYQPAAREEPQRSSYATYQPPPDAQASKHKSSDSEFGDLHNRLQSLARAVEKLEHDMSDMRGDSENKHREVTRGLLTRETLNTISSQSDKLDRIERIINGLQPQLSNLHGVLKDSHDSLSDALPKHIGNLITTNAPRMGMLIFIFVIIQILLYGIYTLYKRRSKQGPKKYL